METFVPDVKFKFAVIGPQYLCPFRIVGAQLVEPIVISRKGGVIVDGIIIKQRKVGILSESFQAKACKENLKQNKSFVSQCFYIRHLQYP
jgi:hypothetical protein